MGPHQTGMRRLRGQDPAHPVSRRAQSVERDISGIEEEMIHIIRIVMMTHSRVAILMEMMTKMKRLITIKVHHPLTEIKMMMIAATAVERSITDITVTAAEEIEAIIIEATEIREEEVKHGPRSQI